MKQIPKDLIEIINYAISFIGSETNDWFMIKRELVNLFPPSKRSRFSRRHFSTKKHILNSFDKSVINYWEKQNEIVLWVDPGKLHPEDWVQKPHGWALRELNEQRRQQKQKAATAASKDSD